MGISWKIALLLTVCLVVVKSEYDPAVCNIIKESYGLTPPILPTNFEFRGEHVDHNQKYAIYEEMYFDFTNSRGKYMYLSKGIEHHFLFDYEVQQVVAYDLLHPGADIKTDPLSHTCTTTDLESSEYRELFGYLEDMSGKRAKMYNSNQALRYSGQYRYAFNGTERMENRGLLVEKFIGCVYDYSMDTTMNATYLFTSKRDLGVAPAAGTLEKEVTGLDNGLLSVPVKADFVGTMYDQDTNSYNPFNYTMSYFWFKGEPEFPAGVFQLPPYMHCTNYRGRKEMPKFPTAFDTRLQKTTLKRDIFGKVGSTEVTSFESVYYYKEKLLARRDYTPDPDDDNKEIKSEFNNFSPVKTIYDFTTGLLYVTNVPSGRCFIRPMNKTDYFVARSDSLYVTMATPEEIFQMQTDEMEYKGKDFTRDIECDVWAGKYYDKNLNATYVKETYISTNGWHEEVDDRIRFGIPVKHAVIQKDLDGELREGAKFYSFLKFIATPPELNFFDVSNCIETQTYKDYALLLTISSSTEQLLFDYKHQFLETAQYYITNASQVNSTLRVQRLEYQQISISDPRPVLLFTLVDKIQLRSKIPYSQKGLSLDEAIATLQTFVDKNQFAIQFYPPKSKDMTLVPALKGSLYVKKADGDLTYYAPIQQQFPSTTTERIQYTVMSDRADDLNEVEDKGMTSGALALLSFAMLFIGIGIGVAVMYLYIRRKRESAMEDRINLSLRTSMEAERSAAAASTENAQ